MAEGTEHFRITLDVTVETEVGGWYSGEPAYHLARLILDDLPQTFAVVPEEQAPYWPDDRDEPRVRITSVKVTEPTGFED